VPPLRTKISGARSREGSDSQRPSIVLERFGPGAFQENEEMTARKTRSSKAGAKKLKLKKETIKDLSLRSEAKDLKGGQIFNSLRKGTSCHRAC
jgi:hypothetical protein